jgi:exodeoxyribonuclease V beta subunit
MNAFDPAGPLPTGTQVIEASAGTGKTYAIVSLAVRYIADGVEVSRLMLVTFSRAATQELRDRARARLRVCAQALTDLAEARRSRDAVIAALAAGTDTEVEVRRRRLLRALSEFDSATIVTTHSFCQRMLDGIGLAGDYDPDTTFLEDTGDLVGEVTTDLFAAHEDSQPPALSVRIARQVAAAAVGDVQAVIEPADADPGSDAAQRVAFAAAVRAEVGRRKRLRSARDFNDLLALLHDALTDPDFGAVAAARIRQRYRVVLVDEFQDTDPLQWDILRLAFHGFVTLVLVGDPKQAIYGFRGADVATYLNAVAAAGSSFDLDVNRRTDGLLLRALQHVYGGAALGDDAIVVTAVRAADEQPQLPIAGAPLVLRYLTRSAAGAGAAMPSVLQVRARIAADVADDIVAALTASGNTSGEGEQVNRLQPSDIAVLVRTSDQGNLVRDALRRAAVPAVFTGAASVFRTPEALAWQQLLAAIAQPHRGDRVRLAALTPLVGCSAAELAFGGDALQSQLATQLRRWAEVCTRCGPAALFEVISAESDLEPQLLATDGGARSLTDLRHLAALLDRAALSQSLGISALERWLADRVGDDRSASAADRGRLLDQDAAAVRIMTVHAAKGLGFPVVYVPYAWDRPRRDSPEVLSLHEGGRRILDVGGKLGPHYRARQVSHQAEDAGEELRLFYVAATRARSRLLLWWAPTKYNTAASPLHRLLFGRHPGQPQPDEAPAIPDDAALPGLLAGWAGPAGGLIAIEAVTPDPAGHVWSPELTSQPPLAVARFARRLDWGWARTSYTRLTRPAGEQTPLASEPDHPGLDDEPGDDAGPLPPAAVTAVAPSLMNALPGGKSFGTLVHAVLEHIDTSAPDLAAEVRARCLEMASRLYARVDVDALSAALLGVLSTPTPCGALADIAPADRLVELGFELPLAGGPDASPASLAAIADLLGEYLDPADPLAGYPALLRSVRAPALEGYLTGSLDAVLRTSGPKYVVVDYKTNRLFTGDIDAAGYDQQTMAAAMLRKHYPLQALLYVVALHRYLRWRQPGYDPEVHLGGVMYLFVRAMVGAATPPGCGVFSWTPPARLVVALSDLLAGR